MLDFPIIQGRGFRNVEDGRPGHRLLVPAAQPQLPRGRRPACSTASRWSSTASASPTTCRCGRCRAAPSPSTSSGPRPTSAGSSTSRPRSPCPSPAACRWACTSSRSRVYLRRSYFPPLVARSQFADRARGRHRAAGAAGRPAVLRLDLQLHRRHLHVDDPRGRLRRHRRPRRDRHRDPRRGQPAELPDARRRVDRQLARPARDVRPHADELRLVGGHHAVARPRPHRRRGRRAAPARPAAGQGAGLHLGAAQVRRDLLGARPAPDLGGAPSSAPWTWPPSSTSSSARRSTRRRRSSTRSPRATSTSSRRPAPTTSSC